MNDIKSPQANQSEGAEKEVKEEEMPNVTPPGPKTMVMPAGKGSGGDKKGLIKITAVVVAIMLVAAGVWFWQQQEINRLKNQSGADQAGDVSTAGSESLVDPADPASWSLVLLGPALVSDGSDTIGTSLGFNFNLPTGWTVKTCENSAAMTAFVSPDKDTQAVCNSEGVSPVVLSANQGDLSDGYDYSDESIYSNYETATETINGVEFTRSTATVENPLEFGPPAGTVLVSYHAVVDGVTYSASYEKQPEGNDLTKMFELLVKTLVITTPETPA